MRFCLGVAAIVHLPHSALATDPTKVAKNLLYSLVR